MPMTFREAQRVLSRFIHSYLLVLQFFRKQGWAPGILPESFKDKWEKIPALKLKFKDLHFSCVDGEWSKYATGVKTVLPSNTHKCPNGVERLFQDFIAFWISGFLTCSLSYFLWLPSILLLLCMTYTYSYLSYLDEWGLLPLSSWQLPHAIDKETTIMRMK